MLQNETRILLQKSVPIQPKTSELLQKFAKNWHLRAQLPAPKPFGREGFGRRLHVTENGFRLIG